jgi:hypothetical protein
VMAERILSWETSSCTEEKGAVGEMTPGAIIGGGCSRGSVVVSWHHFFN